MSRRPIPLAQLRAERAQVRAENLLEQVRAELAQARAELAAWPLRMTEAERDLLNRTWCERCGSHFCSCPKEVKITNDR